MSRRVTSYLWSSKVPGLSRPQPRQGSTSAPSPFRAFYRGRHRRSRTSWSHIMGAPLPSVARSAHLFEQPQQSLTLVSGLMQELSLQGGGSPLVPARGSSRWLPLSRARQSTPTSCCRHRRPPTVTLVTFYYTQTDLPK